MNLLTRFKALVQRLLPRHSFARSVGVLAGGTALAQGIGVLALPLITRLYTPHDFSVLAVFSSIVAIASVAICLRLEIAIPLPEKDEDAANLFALAMGFCTLLSALCAVVVWIFGNALIATVNQPGLRPYLWMLPLGIWLSGAYSAIQFWSTRKKRFLAIAKTRMSQTLGSVIAQIGFGVSSALGAAGLLAGQLISFGAGLFGLGRFAWRNDESIRNAIHHTGMKQVLKAYDRYPKYSTFEALANIAAIQLPIIIIGAVAVGPEAGYLLLAMKAAAIPMALIGGSISQVYLSQAPLEHREDRLADFTLNILNKLIKIGVGPLLFIGIASPTLIPLVFGKDWERAGIMIAWMTPWFVMQFLVSPISMALHVTSHQRLAMANQFLGVILRVGFTALAALFVADFIFEYYAVSSLISYSISFLMLTHTIKVEFHEFLKKLKNQKIHLLLWSILGITTMLLGQLIT